MIIQHFLRGMATLDRATVEQILSTDGLRSRWFRDHGGSDPADWMNLVDDDRLLHHLTRIDEPYDGTTVPYGDESPFISLTAGTFEPSPADATNILHDAWMTALAFATDWGQVGGWVVAGYVTLAGRPSTRHLDYSEEVRDINQHHAFNPFHDEGEVVAKIYVPPLRLRGARPVTTADFASWWTACEGADADIATAPVFTPAWFTDPSQGWIENPRHASATSLGNVRGTL